MNKLIIAISLTILTGCANLASDGKESKNPKEIKECKSFEESINPPENKRVKRYFREYGPKSLSL